ncbi:hypothetical protein KC318_g6973 [Hortaea werneckii]|nr:hypothetical protein KC334_g7164 [Hortaea werneckii]KAI7008254.1 hypothetical protein KC355_g7009 [Hortaea werneckii]KAI7665666.1 hypothetical protein KC318_g6973 [Hortaea werneckii]
MVIGTYVGLATVGGYAWWFIFYQGGPQISFWQLTHFHRCSSAFPEIGCAMFTDVSSRTASTISLSVLVVIEMLNAMNALSSSESLLTLPLWNNMKLIYAITLSMVLHYVLLYTPLLQSIFGIVPLGWEEWKIVLAWSAPIIVIDERTYVCGISAGMRHDNFEVDSERFCQLCGISFNAGRIRRPDEPPDAAWGFYGYNFVAEPDAQASCRSRSCQWRDKSDAGGDAYGILGNDDDDETFGELEYREHLAGPECTCTEGYTGYRISVQEMQHVISCQCLAEKRDGWGAEPGDRDFELEAEHCFLTGISKSGAMDVITGLEPVRHGVSQTRIENDRPSEFGLETGGLCALPLHPRCFELYQRVSLRCFGRVDIDGLWRLREEKGSYVSRFEGMPRNPDVDLVSEKWYSARPGTEYLQRIQLILPSELQHILLEQLSRQDVANLRLVSPAFKQLPQSYFRHLVETEMPWLWEVSELPKHLIDFYRLWCRLHEADGGSQQDLHEREWLERTPKRKLNALRDELESKGSSMSAAEWEERAPKLKEEGDADIQAGYENGMWRRKPTNVLLGLRNRRRIWQDLDVIVRMISELDRTSDRG